MEDKLALADPEADTYLPAATSQILAGGAMDTIVNLFHDANAQLDSAQGALDETTARRVDAQNTLDGVNGLLDQANAAVADALRPVKPGADVSPPVLGDPVLTADEMAGWFKDRLIAGYVGQVDIGSMASLYIDESKAEKVRGDIAFAQAIIETGAFTSPLTTHNNFAGIGACDSCADGWHFDTAVLGVRAQVQLLHAYADKTLSSDQLANAPVGADPDHLSVRGCCETWNRLTGTWATDPNYGPKLLTVYESMLQWALAHRSQPPPLSSPVTALGG
jgi:hypothetical protein